MEAIHKSTKHVVGLLGGSGDPSGVTAYGVFMGMKACLQHRFGHANFSGLHVALQGLGHVGMYLAQYLHEAGARLTVTDINESAVADAVERFGASFVAPQDIFDVEADIFSPCALGGVINDQTVNRLKCQIVAGAANNQLAEPRHGEALERKGILYAPDYLINAGGLINVTYEGPDYDRNKVLKHVDGIYDTMMEILDLAKAQNVSTRCASDRVAEQRFGREPTCSNSVKKIL
jgi:leucine dehydrogenase